MTTTPTVTKRIPLLEPYLGGNEAKYVQECIESNYVSSVGPFVDRFEREFAATVGARHAIACSSGTAALHVALRLAGAGPGKLVAVSDFTFIASANAIVYTGAEPLLVDSERETWNMDTELLHDEVVRRAKLGKQIPEIVEVVHILGHPAKLEPLLDLKMRFGIRIVEDAAESLGAKYIAGPLAGRHVGTIGDFGCYSFNGNKIITTGGGGMIVTNDAEWAAKAEHLTTQARISGLDYIHDSIGYNYRVSNLAAAVGLAQLERLELLLLKKHEIARRYFEGIVHRGVAAHQPYSSWANPSCWLSSVLFKQAVHHGIVLRGLNDAGIELRPFWRPLHLQLPHVNRPRVGLGVADDLHSRGVSLPSSVSLREEEQAHVIAGLRHMLAGSIR